MSTESSYDSDGYTDTPNKVRVYLDDASGEWTVDAVDTRVNLNSPLDTDKQFHPYTIDALSFTTWQDAMAAVPDFIKFLQTAYFHTTKQEMDTTP